MNRETARQIATLRLPRNRALLVVDADEVLVHFAQVFSRWLVLQNWQLELHEYRLLHSIRRADGEIASVELTHELIVAFIDEQTLHQPATLGAADCLADLAEHASIVVLTNVPLHKQTDRIRNLAGHSMPYPVIANTGPKGPALAALDKLTTAPIAFVDDNPEQIDSAAECANHIRRLHFTGCPLVASVLPPTKSADFRPKNWTELNTDLTNFFS